MVQRKKKNLSQRHTGGVLVKITASLRGVGSRRCWIWWIKDLLFTAKMTGFHAVGKSISSPELGREAASFGAIYVWSWRRGGRRRARSPKKDAQRDDVASARCLSVSALLELSSSWVAAEYARATLTVMMEWDAYIYRKTEVNLEQHSWHVQGFNVMNDIVSAHMCIKEAAGLLLDWTQNSSVTTSKISCSSVSAAPEYSPLMFRTKQKLQMCHHNGILETNFLCFMQREWPTISELNFSTWESNTTLAFSRCFHPKWFTLFPHSYTDRGRF